MVVVVDVVVVAVVAVTCPLASSCADTNDGVACGCEGVIHVVMAARVATVACASLCRGASVAVGVKAAFILSHALGIGDMRFRNKRLQNC